MDINEIIKYYWFLRHNTCPNIINVKLGTMFVLIVMAEGKLLKFESAFHAIIWCQNDWDIVQFDVMMFLRHILYAMVQSFWASNEKFYSARMH